MPNSKEIFANSSRVVHTPRPSTVAGDARLENSNCKNCNALDSSGPMVACDICGTWYHQRCVGVSRKIKNYKWVCEECLVSMQATTTKEIQLPVDGDTHNLHRTSSQQNPLNCEALPQIPTQRAPSNTQSLHHTNSQHSHCVVTNIDKSHRTPSQHNSQRTKRTNVHSTRSIISSKRAELDLQRVEEERVLKEKRDKEYLDKRYEVLQRMVEDEGSESYESDEQESRAQERVQQWLQQRTTVNANGNAIKSQGPNLPQIDHVHYTSNIPEVNHTAVPPALNVFHRKEMFNPTSSTTQRNPVSTFTNQVRTQPQQPAKSIGHLNENENMSNQLPTSTFSLPSATLTSDQLAARHVMPKDLPILNGYPEEWPLFFNSFETTTRICGYTMEENLVRLQRCLKGKALESVRSRLLIPSNVPGIISTLRMLYGRPELIINSILQKLRAEPAPKAERLETLVSFSLSVQNLCATIESTGLDAHFNNPMILQELTDKLPPQIKLNWAVYRQNIAGANLALFNDRLLQLAQSISEVSINVIHEPAAFVNKTDKRFSKGRNFVNAHSDRPSLTNRTESPAINKKCCICQQTYHPIPNCRAFQDLSLNSKWDAVREHKLCRICLSAHVRGRCKSETATCGVNQCTFRHHMLLHKYSQEPIRQNNTVDVHTCNTHLHKNQSILFRIVPVLIHGKNKTVTTFAFLDDGSSLTLMDSALAKQLELSGNSEPLCLRWTANTHRKEEDSEVVSFGISGVGGSQTEYAITNAHTVRSLNLPQQTICVPDLAAKYFHLRGVPAVSYQHAIPQILIGLDNWKLGVPLKFREGGENEPIAAKTRIGWSIYGQLPNDTNDFVPSTPYQGFHMCECQHKHDDELQQMVKEYFSLDNFGVANTSKAPLSIEDQRSEQILKSTTIRTEDRFETGLLWKYDDISLPNSYQMAINRMRCLEKKMSSHPELAETLKNKISDYLEKGYIHKLSTHELEIRHSRIWYLPIFTVTNPNKPGKIRIVWDAAAKVNNISLNTMLMKGPDQVTPLPAVLHRFREKKIAICADIREMFHQVRIRAEDKHSQRFLWRNEPSSEPEVYVMDVMTFGASCSPSCAQYVKNKNAEEFCKQFPQAVKAILENHYVDDFLGSVDTEEEALQLYIGSPIPKT